MALRAIHLTLVIAGAAAPARAVAQDSTHTDSLAGPHAIKWWEVGAVAAGGILTIAIVDAPVQEWTSNPEHGSSTGDDIAKVGQYFGQMEVVLPVTGGLILVGLIAKKPGVLHAGYRVGASVLVAGVMTQVFKYSLGRLRPYDTSDQWDFQPFSGGNSMWSGHTATAFAFATALSQEIHNTWATVGLYTLATGTAWSRVYGNEHWVSDVLIGAAVGVASAKLATGRWTIFGLRAPVPLATPGGVGFMWHGTF
jgi:membrane-associated phospholipid phosphatase